MDCKAKIIAVASGKGGVGKTTVASAVAQSLADRGKRVLAVDGDLDFRNLDLLIGLENSFSNDLTDVISGRCPLNDAIYRSTYNKRLFFMAGTLDDETEPRVNREVMGKLLRHLGRYFDYIVVDTAAGTGLSFELYTRNADKVLIVTTLYRPAIRDGEKIASLIREDGVETYLIVNNINERLIEKGDAPDIDEIIDSVSVKLIGLLPIEERLIKWQNSGDTPMEHDSEIRTQLADIVSRLCGEDVKLKPFWEK